MSKVSNNSNYNKVSVKTDSIVEMIQELSKLGVFKEKRKPRAKKAVPTDEIRQEGDMPPGFTTPLGPQMRNLPSIQQIPQGATTQQIQDIQQQNAASLAQLRAEVQQGRISDIQNIGSALFSIVNPRKERFRSQQEAGAGVYDPFERTSSGAIMLPDITQGGFTQTLSEGGPEAVSQLPETVFPVEETENIPTAPLGLQPRGPIEKTGGGRLSKEDVENRKKTARSYGAGWPPPNTSNDIDDIREYYTALSLSSQEDIDESILNNKTKMVAQIGRLLDVIIAL
jgi:hypothetical protein